MITAKEAYEASNPEIVEARRFNLFIDLLNSRIKEVLTWGGRKIDYALSDTLPAQVITDQATKLLEYYTSLGYTCVYNNNTRILSISWEKLNEQA